MLDSNPAHEFAAGDSTVRRKHSVFKNEGCRAIHGSLPFPYIYRTGSNRLISDLTGPHASSSSPYRISAYYAETRFRGSIKLDR